MSRSTIAEYVAGADARADAIAELAAAATDPVVRDRLMELATRTGALTPYNRSSIAAQHVCAAAWEWFRQAESIVATAALRAELAAEEAAAVAKADAHDEPDAPEVTQALVEVESADCDGRYSRSYTLVRDEDEDEDTFKGKVLGLELPEHNEEPVAVRFTRHGFSFSEPTDEGFRAVDVTWLRGDAAPAAPTTRDHSAEAAGY